ncbi:Bud-site selection protein [Xylariaceae sp. FL1272]|nr:Bud-site selection protein [Xylariaceae sp. FL1272]
MPKRKREPSLEERLANWRKELVRALKTAKGFERQRLSKRLREADPDKKTRLEREILVLKSLDLQQAAHAFLCSSLLKIKGMAEAPKLPSEIKPVPKPDLSEEEKSALHNVTSALCNRKHVKDVIEEAVMGTCIALRVPMPEKRKGKGKEDGRESEKPQPKATSDKKASKHDISDDGSESEEQPDTEELTLLRRKVEREEGEGDLESDDGSAISEDAAFQGFSDSDAEERMFAKYDGFVGGSSDEDDDFDEDNEDDAEATDSRSELIKKLAPGDISLSELEDDEDDDEDESDSEDEGVSPPPKKQKVATPANYRPGNSAFLPTLMGGYISGSESEASDVDVAPPTRKNRRGQRARQAIWEKKYGDKAKHHENQKDARNAGWDFKRGAVDTEGSSKPWKSGISNPFENGQVHPDRQRAMQRGDDEPRRGRGKGGFGQERQPPRQQEERSQVPRQDKPKPRLPPSRDDLGALHPSWAAAKAAKDGSQKVEFKGKKVTFD